MKNTGSLLYARIVSVFLLIVLCLNGFGEASAHTPVEPVHVHARAHHKYAHGKELAINVDRLRGSAVNATGLGAAASLLAPYNINIVIHTGQSLATGATATPAGTSTHNNLGLTDTLVTWTATHLYAAHSWVSPGTKFAYTNPIQCTTGSGPSWSVTVGGTTSDGSCTWTTDHAVADAASSINEPWVAGGTYGPSFDGETFLHPANSACIQHLLSGSGPSGVTQPTWNVTYAATPQTDGLYTWGCFFSSNVGQVGGAYGYLDITNTTHLNSLSLVTYSQPVRSLFGSGSEYPRNVQGNPPTLAFLDSVSVLTAQAGAPAWVLAGSDVGQGGQAMSVIEYNGTGNNFQAGITEATNIIALAHAQGLTAGVVAILLTHGEADSGNTSYGVEVQALQAAYQGQLQVINGNTRPIPLVGTQQSTTPIMPSPWNTAYFPISAYQLLSVNDGRNVVVAGPKYAEPRNSTDQHMPAAGYNQIGDLMAEAYVTVAKGQTFHPLQPIGGALNPGAYSASTSSTTITITLDNPYAPLVFDTTTIGLNHQSNYTEWANGYGLEVWDSVGHITINSVTISGNNLVIALASLPHTGLHVTYASTSDATTAGAGGYGGDPGGHYGNIRNSNPYVGPYSGASLWDWLCIFESPALTENDMPAANDNGDAVRSEAA